MLRFPRFVSVLLALAFSWVVVSGQGGGALSPGQKGFGHNLKITSRYNKSSDTTAVQLLLKRPDNLSSLASGGTFARAEYGQDIAISVFFSHAGKQLSGPVDEALIWIVYTGGPRTAVKSELNATVDGRDVALSQRVNAQANPDSRKGVRVSSLTLSVAREQLAQLANASTVVLAMPSGERLTLTREQLSALADFTGRMSP